MRNVKADFRKENEVIKNIFKSDKWMRALYKYIVNSKVSAEGEVESQGNEIDLELEEELESKVTLC